MRHTEFMGNIYKVSEGKSGTDATILRRLLGQVEAMLSHHSKVTILRIDLHQRRYTADNSHLSNFWKSIIKHCQRYYSLSRVGYGWVREQERAKSQHYHACLMLDGNRAQNPFNLLVYIGKQWDFYNDGSHHIPRNPVMRITRANDKANRKAVGEAVYRLSYLAKGRGKGYRGANASDYSTSRIKPFTTENKQ